MATTVEATITLTGGGKKTVSYDSDGGGNLSSKEKAAISKAIKQKKIDLSKIEKITPDPSDGGPIGPADIGLAKAVAKAGAPAAKPVTANPGVRLFGEATLKGGGVTTVDGEKLVTASGEIKDPPPQAHRVAAHIEIKREGSKKDLKEKTKVADISFTKLSPGEEVDPADAKNFFDQWEKDPRAKDALTDSKVTIGGTVDKKGKATGGKTYTISELQAIRDQPISATGSPEDAAASNLADTLGMTLGELKKKAKEDRDFAFKMILALVSMGIDSKTFKFIVQAYSHLMSISMGQANAQLLDRLQKTSDQEQKLIARLDRSGVGAQEANAVMQKIQSLGRSIQMDSNNAQSFQTEVHSLSQLTKSFFDAGAQEANLFAWK